MRRSVKELTGACKLNWSWIRIPRGMQLDVNVDCGNEKVDIVGVDVSIFSFCPPPVSQMQMLLRKERTVGRQVSCSDKITQEESTLASISPGPVDMLAKRR